jgi:hypothetical protein
VARTQSTRLALPDLGESLFAQSHGFSAAGKKTNKNRTSFKLGKLWISPLREAHHFNIGHNGSAM